jgi:hypothetical protein
VTVAAAAGWPPGLVIRPRVEPAIVSGMPDRPIPAVVITPVPPVPAAHAMAAGPLRGVLWMPRPHVPGGQNNDDEDNHDNYCQGNHKLSHRTIQSGMASQCSASEAHAAIDADLTQ